MLCLQVDILHPLATLEWEKCWKVSLPEEDEALSAKCVVMGEKIYMSTHISLYESTNLKSWTKLPQPLPASHGTLTTYHSQLVLVGGTHSNTTSATNKLWSLSEAGVWQESLPPMPTERCRPGVLSVTDPECLIVIGGSHKYEQIDSLFTGYISIANQKKVQSIEVLIGDQWFVAEHPPSDYLEGGVVHNGMLYVHERHRTGHIFSCDLQSLIASCRHPDADRPLKWTEISEIRDPISNILSFGQQLVMVCNDSIFAHQSALIDEWPWVHIGCISY